MSKVRCELCPTECELGDYEVGGCKVRVNRGGELYSLVYGKPCSAHVDPIEKKPFFHFLPGSKAFSIATVGCVLGCKFCQNWEISQASPEKADNIDLPPDQVVRGAMVSGSKSVCYTYTEPTVFYEYMYDTSVLAHRYGIRNTMHTCGYISEAPLRELCKHMDAADIDLKAFTEDFYGRICGGRLKPVLDSIVTTKEEGVWLEITNLVIPTLNDDPKEVQAMCEWIVCNVGPDVPIHFSRFFPYYKLKNLPPTPAETMYRVRQIALDAGMRYVYIGNMRTNASHTFCHNCGKQIIDRFGYYISAVRITEGKCNFCQTEVPGIWE
ncbi:AmmeMemoRadiSam system radical SAM enzyme [Nitrospirota bacterium]